MSVLKKDRHNSQIQYVYNAWLMEKEGIHFLFKISKRLRDLFCPILVESLSQIATYTARASEFYRKELSKVEVESHHHYLLEAYASLQSFDSQVTMLYDLVNENPGGSFEKDLSEKDARRKLDHTVEVLGALISEEMKLLEDELEKARQALEKFST